MEQPKTPELDKRAAAIPEAEVLTRFYDWLQEQGYHIAAYSYLDDGYFPIPTSPEQLFADFFGIDRDKIEQERRAVLNYIRERNLADS